MVKAVYAGSFDPIHLGHLNVIVRSLNLCDELIVAVGINHAKKGLFSFAERKTLVQQEINKLPILLKDKIVVDSFQDLLVNYAKRMGASLLIRGVRTAADFESEMQFALINRALAGIDSVFIPTEHSLSLASSSAVKELISYKSPAHNMVSDEVEAAVYEKIHNLKGV